MKKEDLQRQQQEAGEDLRRRFPWIFNQTPRKGFRRFLLLGYLFVTVVLTIKSLVEGEWDLVYQFVFLPIFFLIVGVINDLILKYLFRQE